MHNRVLFSSKQVNYIIDRKMDAAEDRSLYYGK